jgi:hypothetical protein
MIKLAFTCARQLLTIPRAGFDCRLRRSLKRRMKPYIPLFALGIVVSAFANSLLADPETSAAIKDHNQKLPNQNLIAQLPTSSSSIDRTDATPAYQRADLILNSQKNILANLGLALFTISIRAPNFTTPCKPG